MSLVFLHTADWQLGKPFASVRDDAKRHRLQQERLQAVQRLADLAKSSDAAFVLVAGDMFDSSHATKATVSAACAAIGALKIPVLVIPGKPLPGKKSGINIRVGGKIIGKPHHFGLENGDALSDRLRRRIVGEMGQARPTITWQRVQR